MNMLEFILSVFCKLLCNVLIYTCNRNKTAQTIFSNVDAKDLASSGRILVNLSAYSQTVHFLNNIILKKKKFAEMQILTAGIKLSGFG